jgi:hypothetical protein
MDEQDQPMTLRVGARFDGQHRAGGHHHMFTGVIVDGAFCPGT